MTARTKTLRRGGMQIRGVSSSLGSYSGLGCIQVSSAAESFVRARKTMCNQRWMNRSECQIPCKTAGEYTGMRLENAPHKMLLSGSCGGRMAPRDAGAGAGWDARCGRP